MAGVSVFPERIAEFAYFLVLETLSTVTPKETICVGNAFVSFLQSGQRIHNPSVPLAYNGGMKAVWNNQVIAEAPQEDLIRIEGNWYFPPRSIKREFFKDSDRHTICPWKGEASYYDVVVDGNVNDFGAWYYPEPTGSSIDRVKRDFTNYVAFWNGISVVK